MTGWGNNTGIRVLRTRKHGFVSVDAPYTFGGAAPSFTTVPMRVPTGCPPPTTTTSRTVATGCSYEHSDGKCPASQPAAACRTDADCAAVNPADKRLTCHGVQVTCQPAGTCGTGRKGGTLCAANVTKTTTTGGAQLFVNMQTSVVGSVAVGVHGDSGPYALANANAVVGNSLDAAASWGGGGGRGADAAASFTSSLSALAGQSVAFEVAMRDAKLFSLELRCGGEKK